MNRYCFVLQVKRDRVSEYRERHALVWPEMLGALHDTGWTNYSLFLRPDGLLVGYVEAEDLDASVHAMSRLAVNTRWQAEMAEFFESIEDRRPDEGFQLLDEVFNLDAQLDTIAPDAGATGDDSR